METPKEGGAGGDVGTFLEQWGLWLITVGGIALALALGVAYFAGGKIGRGVAITALGILATGIAFVYIGPWLAWIVGVTILLILVTVAFLVWRNRARIVDAVEEATGLEVDGKP